MTRSPFGPEFAADPYPVYEALRAAGPVHRVATPDGQPAWVVVGYQEVRAGLADPRLSLSRRYAADGYRGFALPPALDANLLNLDPPDHTRLRRLATGAFTAGRVAALAPRVAAEADALLDGIAGAGRADLMSEYAVPLPLAVIGDLLGVDRPDRESFRYWADVLLDPPADAPKLAVRAVEELSALLVRLIAARRAAPADDLLSALVAAHDGGDALTSDELMSLAFLVLWAGHENSVHLIGNAVLTALGSPAWRQRLGAGPLDDATVEELLRYAMPTQFAIRRFAVEEMTLGGARIGRGDTVLLGIAAANRDPAVFDRPADPDPDRAANPHLSLGRGVHHCLGAPLARLELRIAVPAVVRRFPALRLATGDLAWRATFRSHGLRELPVTW